MTKSNLNQINKADIPKLFLQEIELANGYDSPTDLLLEIRKINEELYKICKYVLSKKGKKND
jgi:hypothetical protein